MVYNHVLHGDRTAVTFGGPKPPSKTRRCSVNEQKH